MPCGASPAARLLRPRHPAAHDLAHGAPPARRRGPGLRRPHAHGHGRARSRRRSAGSRASSSTRSRPSSAATGSRSRRGSATTRAATVSRLLAAGRVFEYWAHEACLLPVEEWPLFASQMHEGGRRWYGDVGETHPHLARGDPGGDPGARAARVAPLRRRDGGRDVELEAGQGDARPALEPRRPRHRRPAGLPAALRPPRARDSRRRCSTLPCPPSPSGCGRSR